MRSPIAQLSRLSRLAARRPVPRPAFGGPLRASKSTDPKLGPETASQVAVRGSQLRRFLHHCSDTAQDSPGNSLEVLVPHRPFRRSSILLVPGRRLPNPASMGSCCATSGDSDDSSFIASDPTHDACCP